MLRQPPTSQPAEIATPAVNAGSKTAPEASIARVLLLEDRDDLRLILHDYLTSRSYEVVSVRSGVEGLREIMKSRFELIICDMMMPKVGGEMFYWAVTRVKRAAGQRFIFVTGHQNNPAIEFFFKRVKATVLIKPFKLAALDAAIKDVFRKMS